VRYSGYHELAYLSKQHFTFDDTFYDRYNLDRNQRIFILRFVSWGASHDIGHAGLSFEMKRRLVDYLSSKGRLIITSEGELPDQFAPYRLTIPPEEIHNLLSVSDLYVGEGATMASEAAVLGTSAVYISTLPLGYISDQEQHGIVKHFNPEQFTDSGKCVFEYIKTLVDTPALKARAKAQSMEMLADKIEVTSWMKDFIKTEVSG